MHSAAETAPNGDMLPPNLGKEYDRDSPASRGQKSTPPESAPNEVKQQPTGSEEDASSNSDLPPEGSAPAASSHTAEPLKQNRPCAVCKLNHVACDRARPCIRCRRAGKEKECVDPPLTRRGRKPSNHPDKFRLKQQGSVSVIEQREQKPHHMRWLQQQQAEGGLTLPAPTPVYSPPPLVQSPRPLLATPQSISSSSPLSPASLTSTSSPQSQPHPLQLSAPAIPHNVPILSGSHALINTPEGLIHFSTMPPASAQLDMAKMQLITDCALPISAFELTWAANYTIISATRDFANLLGYTLEEFIGLQTMSLHPVRSLRSLVANLVLQPDLSTAYSLLLEQRAHEHNDLNRTDYGETTWITRSGTRLHLNCQYKAVFKYDRMMSCIISVLSVRSDDPPVPPPPQPPSASVLSYPAPVPLPLEPPVQSQPPNAHLTNLQR